MSPMVSMDYADLEFLVDTLLERASHGDDRALQIFERLAGMLGIEQAQGSVPVSQPEAKGLFSSWWWS